MPILEGFPLMSTSIKDVFEFGMSSSLANLDPSTWSMTVTQEPKKYSISLKAGEPVYLWKWHVAAMTSDSTFMVAKTSISTWRLQLTKVLPHTLLTGHEAKDWQTET